MRCRRICRELLWLARFGEFGPSSQPHLDHLASCSSCRDEVGYDREMVRQLRVALAARIEGMSPSSHAWEGILARAQAPEPGRWATWWSRSVGIVGRLRTATAMAGTGLALVLALNTQILPAAPAVEASTDAETTRLQQVPRLPTGRTALVVLVRQGDGYEAQRPDPEQALTEAEARLTPRELTPVPAVEQSPATIQIVFRPLQSPEPIGHGSAAAIPTTSVEGATQTEPGQPS
jgi:hypothetical protein